MKWELLCKRTNYPKLGYIITRLKEQGIKCRLNGESWHAPILEVEATRIIEASAILGQCRLGFRKQLDDVPDDHPKFAPYAEVKP
jgi:hypothetical protein